MLSRGDGRWHSVIGSRNMRHGWSERRWEGMMGWIYQSISSSVMGPPGGLFVFVGMLVGPEAFAVRIECDDKVTVLRWWRLDGLFTACEC